MACYLIVLPCDWQCVVNVHMISRYMMLPNLTSFPLLLIVT